MIAEAGLFCLILALMSALLQTILPFLSARHHHLPFYMVQRGATAGQFLALTLAFYALIYAYITSDFSLKVVAANSHSAKPMLYKFTGSWGNHEGSILLWAWILAFCGFLLARKRAASADAIMHSRALSAQGIVSLGTLMFILGTSNPFARHFPQPVEGAGLNPLLQDIGLALHPPILYMGYVGFSIVFSLAVAAMLTGRMGKGWAQMAHPWIMFSWSFLTLGIGMGSWWAYRELGWGGWWFWDPVENASLLPWLAGTALLHSNLVLAKRSLMQRWVLLLAILTFSLSLLGTFLVRSGLLTSVHAFANDPARGMFILSYIACITGGALWLYATRPITSTEKRLHSLWSREGGILLNNLFLVTGCATILLATSYPLILQAFGLGTVSIGPPYYAATFIPLMVPVVLFAALAPFLSWKRTTATARRLRPLHPAWMAALVAALIITYMQTPRTALSALGIGLAVWLTASCIALLSERAHFPRLPLAHSIARLRQQPAGFYAMLSGHLGVALLVAGITGSTLWQQEIASEITPGTSLELSGHTITYQQEHTRAGENYIAQQALLAIETSSGAQLSLTPELRHYPAQNRTTSESAIHSTMFYDLYAVTGTTPDGSRITLHAYRTPLILCVWGGCLLMAAAGGISWFGTLRTAHRRRKYEKN